MDNTIYCKNYEIIKEKWPSRIAYLESLNDEVDITFLEDTTETTLVYNGCHLSSCYNREKEAKIQNSTIPLSAKKANLYGIGLGDGVNDLLKRKYLNSIPQFL